MAATARWGQRPLFTTRGDPFITFAPRGGRWVQKLPKFANDSTDRLREMRTRVREGFQNPENFADVLNLMNGPLGTMYT